MNNERLYFLLGLTSGIAIATVTSILLNALLSHETRGIAQERQCRSDSPRRHRGSISEDTMIRLEAILSISTAKLHEIVKHFVKEITQGLSIPDSTLAMIPSHVSVRATGQEKGTYLALDLGGTNFRVCEVNLEGNGAGMI